MAQGIDCVVCCEENVSVPVKLTFCEHTFCLPCLRRWCFYGAKVIPHPVDGVILSVPEPTCPLCKLKFSYSIRDEPFPSKCANIAVIMTKSQSVECPGCDKKIKTNKLFEHISSCVTTPCPACEQQFAEWSPHLLQECTKVPVPCCSFTGNFEATKRHLAQGSIACGFNQFFA